MELNIGIRKHNFKNETIILPTGYENNFVSTWFLMGSPIPVIVMLLSYLLFVLKLGPEYMRKRKPCKLQNIMPIYNAVQVLLSCFLMFKCHKVMMPYGLVPKTCVMETEHNKNIAAAIHYYLLAKISELLDTIFFVLRKKDKQVSFLHMYHHTLMVTVSWTALKYEPTYVLMFLGIINSFVHVIMYTYYGLSTIPGMAKFLWWKKYITSMQLIQFVIVLIHFGMTYMRSECNPSFILSIAMTTNGILFLYLFGDFYINTYRKPKTTKTIQSNGIEFNTDSNLYETNLNLHKIESKFNNGNGKICVGEISNDNKNIGNENKYSFAFITINDTYRIKFNFHAKKWI